MPFLAGETLTAAGLNGATGGISSGSNSVAGTTGSTSYTSTLAGTTAVTLAFVAPPSGRMEVIIAAACDNSGAFYSTVSFGISGAAGTLSPSDDYQAYANGTDEGSRERRSIVTGLIAGQAGLITMYHKVSGGTGTFNHRSVGANYKS